MQIIIILIFFLCATLCFFAQLCNTLAIMKIYTKTGDKGTTSLLDGTRVEKYHPRINAYGTIDELNSWVGVLREFADIERTHTLIEIQETLFSMGSHLAVEPGKAKFPMPTLPVDGIEKLEYAIDAMDKTLPPLRSFVLPGGHLSVSYAHIARTVCRRAERAVVELATKEQVDAFIIQYLNRLSDFLFMLSRKFTQEFSVEETPWNPVKEPKK